MSRGGNLRNPCLTMHQPWASLLVYGIKRIEGRSWPAPLRGRLWIHAAGKVPDSATIKAMEDFYREIYAVNGITDLKFPEHYPVSRLLGCVEVVGCLKCEELVCWDEVPEGVRLEGQTDFCWLCEQPQRLLVPFEMRGFQGVYNLEKRIYEAAVRGLCPVECPLPSLNAAIAGARAAATQFSKKGQSNLKSDVQNLPSTSESKNNRVQQEVDTKGQFGLPDGRFQRGNRCKYVERKSLTGDEANIIENNRSPNGDFNQKSGAPSKVVLYLINLWWPQNV
ncbi:RNA-binding ASCH domain-containing protein [Cinnamomum micranthum f. kanehirae]|uniref:RNA-binding ASCH domain-containing protein n=1 Tax=Cinnamomum micranthum f. kanehirae TaxID=337451 RepID=A0A443NLG4_9MAGN|nr:RNA-binding ASCH domain-containing protein [Cinnamomum micranthum f. kanehirae]